MSGLRGQSLLQAVLQLGTVCSSFALNLGKVARHRPGINVRGAHPRHGRRPVLGNSLEQGAIFFAHPHGGVYGKRLRPNQTRSCDYVNFGP